MSNVIRFGADAPCDVEEDTGNDRHKAIALEHLRTGIRQYVALSGLRAAIHELEAHTSGLRVLLRRESE
jgi:hypothetical protein